MCSLIVPPICYKPDLGEKTDFGIGIVGAGAIVEAAHLPAYQKARFNVVGIFDQNLERARRLSDRFTIPKVFPNLDALLTEPGISIVDIAVPPSSVSDIAIKAFQAGKHVLSQKPLAPTFSEARALVKQAAQSKRKLAVNENMRWDPAIRASKHLIDEGWIGVPVLAALEVNYWENWNSWPWLTVAERLTILIDAIHPLYSFRMLFGEPTRVYCVKGRSPEQKERGETHALISLEFAEGPNGLILDCSTNPTNVYVATFRFDGTEGSIKGTLGIWYNYPLGAADTLTFSSRTKSRGFWISAELEDRWVPDAFIGPMGALMKAIHENTDPENSGSEHLKTLQIVEAAYLSAAEKRPVSPQEISVKLDI